MGFFKKIAKKYRKIRHGEKYVLAHHKHLKMLLRATNHVDRKLLGGRYETDQISKVVSIINEKNIDYFVDVGANIGVYSLRVASECSGLEKVFSIEAQVENYNQLCGNIRLNNLDRVIEARNMGASDKSGEVEFLVNKGSSTGTSRIKGTAPVDTKLRKFDSHMVSVDKLDNILKGLKNKSIFFKIDVEGHERNVLLGMKDIVKNNHCLFQIEILDHDNDRVIEGFDFKKIDQIGSDVYFESMAI